MNLLAKCRSFPGSGSKPGAIAALRRAATALARLYWHRKRVCRVDADHFSFAPAQESRRQRQGGCSDRPIQCKLAKVARIQPRGD